MTVRITAIKAREILDSRGNPTVEAEIGLDDGRSVRAAVPSGASKGLHEALELRDNDPQRYGGLGVQKACLHIKEKIAPMIRQMDPVMLPEIDRRLIELDGTPNKSALGANAILAVSLAAAKAGALLRAIPLYRHLADIFKTKEIKIPTPFLNFINGGRHANNGLSVQEFMIVPCMKGSFRETLRSAAEIFQRLKKILVAKGDSAAVGDEGGFAPQGLSGPLEAMELLLTAARETGYIDKIHLALDLAASEFYVENGYMLYPERAPLTPEEMIEEFKNWLGRYPLISLEDPLAQDDWEGWARLTKELCGSAGSGQTSVLLVGDDLFVTNPKRLQRGLDERAANAILIKPNQIGTITETAEVIRMAHANGYAAIASHRSGETEDAALAHIAVGLAADGIKTGSVSRSERLAKYNELLRIEEGLGSAPLRDIAALAKTRAPL